MSIRVAIEELGTALESYPWGYLVTVDDESRAHLVALPTQFVGGRFRCSTGERTRANAIARPNVALVFPPTEPGGYSLIVDGAAEADGDAIVVEPSNAVLHHPAPAVG